MAGCHNQCYSGGQQGFGRNQQFYNSDQQPGPGGNWNYNSQNSGGNWNQNQQGNWNGNQQGNWGNNQNSQGWGQSQNNQNWNRNNTHNDQGFMQNQGQDNRQWNQNSQENHNQNRGYSSYEPQYYEGYQNPGSYHDFGSQYDQFAPEPQQSFTDSHMDYLEEQLSKTNSDLRRLQDKMGQLIEIRRLEQAEHVCAIEDVGISQAETKLTRLNREIESAERDLAIANKERAIELEKEQEAQTKRDKALEVRKEQVIYSEADLEKAKLNEEIARLREENADFKKKWEDAKAPKKDSVVLDHDETTPSPPRQEGMKGRLPPPPPDFDVSTLPFPPKVSKKNALTESQDEFLEMLGKVEIIIPLLKAVASVPAHCHLLKGMLSGNDRLQNIVCLSEEVSAIFDAKIPPKMHDKGSFTIPVAIGTTVFPRVLCDLGASVNLMPKGIYEKLGLGELEPTGMTLQMADRSVRHPMGVVEDVMVQVGKFSFPVDFVVLDMNSDSKTPLLLGRPFLNTGRTLIDVESGDIMFRVRDESVTVNVYKSMRNTKEGANHDCFLINDVFACVEESTNVQGNEDSLQKGISDLEKVADKVNIGIKENPGSPVMPINFHPETEAKGTPKKKVPPDDRHCKKKVRRKPNKRTISAK